MSFAVIGGTGWAVGDTQERRYPAPENSTEKKNALRHTVGDIGVVMVIEGLFSLRL
jgi:hypothetical protein